MRVDQVASRGGWLVRVTGTIDERFDPAALGPPGGGVLVIDLGGVTRITSFGVRQWLAALRGLTADYFCFVRCRPAMVAQFNMVASFGGRGELITFYAPYLCSRCKREVEVLVDLRDKPDLLRVEEPPAQVCPDCGGSAPFDDVPEAYFAYAAAQPAPRPPSAVEGILSGTPAQRPLRVAKDVDGGVTALWLSGSLQRAAACKRLADGVEGELVLVLRDLSEWSDDGLRGLQALAAGYAGPVALARVRLELARALADRGVRVASIMAPVRCANCASEAPREVDAAALALLGSPVGQVTCEECGAAGLEVPLRAALGSGLALDEPGSETARYLARHRAPSSADDGELGRFGRYELLSRIGAGGMAEVFLARQEGPGGFRKEVVIKRILPHLSADPEFSRMFLAEARLAARIANPHVVQTLELGEVGGRYFICLEHVAGQNLAELLRACAGASTQLPVELALRICADVCAALAAAHEAKDDAGRPLCVVHRDVSPSNVLLSHDGYVKLTDFGIAKALGSTDRTPTDLMKGKLAYLAPEQIRAGGGATDARSDLFAAGVLLFECLTLQHPFRRPTELATMEAVLHAPLPKLSRARPDAPRPIERVLQRALARDPAQRYQTASDLQENLEGLIATLGRPAGSRELAQFVRGIGSAGSRPPARDAEVTMPNSRSKR